MAVRTLSLIGEKSFRGVGFVKIDGILYPVCGSRGFNFSANSKVEYNPRALEVVPIEQDRKGIFLVFADFQTPSSVIRESIDHANQAGRILLSEGIEEGIPGGIQYYAGSGDAYSLTAPFRLKMPDTLGMAYPQATAAAAARPALRVVDDLAPAMDFSSYDAPTGAQFFSEIWIP